MGVKLTDWILLPVYAGQAWLVYALAPHTFLYGVACGMMLAFAGDVLFKVTGQIVCQIIRRAKGYQ